jgi:DNA repair exonuclease SbcCD ATPase subunit
LEQKRYIDKNTPQIMSKVQDFNHFVDSHFKSKSGNSHLQEGFMDSLANAIDSLMPFSKTKTINSIIDNMLEYEKDLLKAKYELKKTLKSMEMKLREIKGRTTVNPEAVESIREEIEAKKNEYRAMVKSKTVALEKAKDLLRREGAKSPRLKEVMKAKMAELEIELAEFEYEQAKKISSEAGEIQNLKDALEQAKKEAQEMLDKLTAAPTP